MTLRNTDVIPQPGTCEGSKNGSIFATVGGVWWAYAIRPYNWIRVVLRKTTPFSSPSVTSVGSIQYAPTTGYVRSFEISMQFPNRVRVTLRNTDAISQLGTYAPSKNSPVFVPFGAVGWGVFATPLQSGTYDPSKYRCNSPTGHV